MTDFPLGPSDSIDDLLNWAAGELPLGFIVYVGVENGAAWIDIETDEGETIQWEDDGDHLLVDQFKAAVLDCKKRKESKSD